MLNLFILRQANVWQFAGNRETHVHPVVLVKRVCVVFLWEFYYHFDSHKNPIRSTLVNSMCIKTSGVWRAEELSCCRIDDTAATDLRSISATWLRRDSSWTRRLTFRSSAKLQLHVNVAIWIEEQSDVTNTSRFDCIIDYLFSFNFSPGI